MPEPNHSHESQEKFTLRQLRIRPKAERATHQDLHNLVPEVGLEPTSLAAADFESAASTIPPLGPLKRGLAPRAGRVNNQISLLQIVCRKGIAVGHLPRL